MSTNYDRRQFMSYFASVGLGSTLLPGVLWAKVAAGEEITASSIAAAEELAGLKFDDAERTMMLEGLKLQEGRIEALHKIALSNSVSPAIVFDPMPVGKFPPHTPKRPMVRSTVAETSSKLRTSHDWNRISAPFAASSAAVAAPASRSKSAIVTFAPAPASAAALALPIPIAAPVTIATRPSSSPIYEPLN